MAKKNKKLTNLDVAEIVESEGLDYAITSYMGSTNFEDANLAELWDQAQDILGQIESILANATDESDQDNLG